jgi:hypothetical protein
VNAICPGYIATEMVKAIDPAIVEKNILPGIPVGRLGEPEEIARAVEFLAGEDAGFITGSTLSINGGQYMVVTGRAKLDRVAQRSLRRGHVLPRRNAHRLRRGALWALLALLTAATGAVPPFQLLANASRSGAGSGLCHGSSDRAQPPP